MATPTTPISVELLNAALAYADQGFPVLPLAPGDKRPLTEHGVKDASTLELDIRRWWTKWPSANIGLAIPEGFVVLDVDDRDALDGRPLPATPTARTARGFHYWFLLPAGVRARNGRLADLPRVDVKTCGGYVVVPPSGHPSGVLYTWGDFLALDEVPVAPAPDWLVKSLRARRNGQADRPAPAGWKGLDEALEEEKIPVGRRNTELTRFAGRLRAVGFSFSELEEALLLANRQRCSPPLDEGEVRRIARSVAGYPRGPVRVDRRLLAAGLSPGTLTLALALAAGVPDEELGTVLRASRCTLWRRWAELRARGLEEIARAIPRRRYVTIPRGVVHDQEIPEAARVTAAFLAVYMQRGRATVTVEQLARRRGRHPREIKRDLRALRQAGYLVTDVAAYRGDIGRRWRPNTYAWAPQEMQNVDTELAPGCAERPKTASRVSPAPPNAPGLFHQHPLTTETTCIEAVPAVAVNSPKGGRRAPCAAARPSEAARAYIRAAAETEETLRAALCAALDGGDDVAARTLLEYMKALEYVPSTSARHHARSYACARKPGRRSCTR